MLFLEKKKPDLNLIYLLDINILLFIESKWG